MNCKKTYHQAQNIQSALFLQRERSTYSIKLRKIGKVYKTNMFMFTALRVGSNCL